MRNVGGACPRLTKPTSASTNARFAQRALKPWRRFVRIAVVNLFDDREKEKWARLRCSGALRAPVWRPPLTVKLEAIESPWARSAIWKSPLLEITSAGA